MSSAFQSLLNPNQLYEGVVQARRGRTYDVVVEERGITLTGCLYAAGAASALLGIKSKLKLAPGTRCLVTGTVPSVIVKTISVDAPDTAAAGAFRATASQDTPPGDVEDFDNFEGDRLPYDAVEGEFDMTNDLGVGVQVLTLLAKLQASELAKVECFALDDHVRIISRTFHHMTDFGDVRVINDHGRISVVQHGVAHEHESFGQLEDKSAKADVKDFVVGEVAETARWRFSQYVGFLGDFLHAFYTDPVNTIASLAQDRAGKLRVWHGQDGTFMVSSIGDIVLERVVAIAVPSQQQEIHSKDGNKEPDATHLDSWTFDAAQPWRAAFQLREYARWLNQYHAYAAFLRYPKDWKVAAEAEVPAARYQNADSQAAKQPEAVQTPRVTYACWRLMRDGSILSLNGYGSVIMQAGPDVMVSSPRDLRLEAGRDITLVAGGSIFGKARLHIELAAVTGAFIAKARTRWAGMCEQGTMLLRTLMKAGLPEDTTPETHRFGDLKLGIVLDAPHASTLVSGGATVLVEGGHDDLTENTGVVISSRNGSVDIKVNQESGKIRMLASTLAIRASILTATMTKYFRLLSPFSNLGNALFIRSGMTYVRTLIGQRIAGRVMTHGTPMTGTPVEGSRGAPPHQNHVGYESHEETFTIPDLPAEDGTANDVTSEVVPVVPVETAKQARVLSEYLPVAAYQTDPLEQTVAQQIAEQSSPHPSGGSFDAWLFEQDGVAGDTLAQHKLPWPGQVRRMHRYYSAQQLHQPSNEAPSQHTPNRAAGPEMITPRMHVWRA